uniref:Uncharacterized protein n=1 Tax=Anguilla anguilla TaxID=7936 RepID=A0A0E9VNX4_ANGAN
MLVDQMELLNGWGQTRGSQRCPEWAQ